jgi:hypothetical protein
MDSCPDGSKERSREGLMVMRSRNVDTEHLMNEFYHNKREGPIRAWLWGYKSRAVNREHIVPTHARSVCAHSRSHGYQRGDRLFGASSRRNPLCRKVTSPPATGRTYVSTIIIDNGGISGENSTGKFHISRL